MSEDFPKICRPDTSLFCENQRKFPVADLRKYAGQWVAWSPDGTQLLAHGDDLDATMEALKAAGHNPHAVVWDQLDPPDVDSFLGAGFEFDENSDAK